MVSTPFFVPPRQDHSPTAPRVVHHPPIARSSTVTPSLPRLGHPPRHQTLKRLAQRQDFALPGDFVIAAPSPTKALSPNLCPWAPETTWPPNIRQRRNHLPSPTSTRFACVLYECLTRRNAVSNRQPAPLMAPQHRTQPTPPGPPTQPAPNSFRHVSPRGIASTPPTVYPTAGDLPAPPRRAVCHRPIPAATLLEHQPTEPSPGQRLRTLDPTPRWTPMRHQHRQPQSWLSWLHGDRLALAAPHLAGHQRHWRPPAAPGADTTQHDHTVRTHPAGTAGLICSCGKTRHHQWTPPPATRPCETKWEDPGATLSKRAVGGALFPVQVRVCEQRLHAR